MFLPIKQICPEYDGKNVSDLETDMDHFAIPVRSFETLNSLAIKTEIKIEKWLCYAGYAPNFFEGCLIFLGSVYT